MTQRTFTLNVLGPDTTAPTVPAGLTATAVSSSQINLSWTASTDPAGSFQVASGVSGYSIFRNGSPIAQVAAPATTYQSTGLTANTSYTYTVAAIDSAGNSSAQSSSASATTSAASGPTVTVSWSAPTVNVDGTVASIDGYYVYAGQSPPPAAATYSGQITNPAATSYAWSVGGWASGVWYFWVRSYKGATLSEPSGVTMRYL